AKVFSHAADGRKTSVQDVSNIKADAYEVEGTTNFYGAPGTATITKHYDAADLPAEVLFHDAAGTLLRRVTFVRDPERRLVLEELQWGDPASLPEMQPILNAVPAEERSAALVLLAQQFTWSTRYEYDGRGRLSSLVRRMGAMGEERSLYRYDDRG